MLKKTDSQIANLIKKETDRVNSGLNLIASENYPSQAVREAMSCILTAKYAEGYPQRRYYSGTEYVDKIEQLAIDRAKKLFNAEYANVQPHSGSQANQAVYQAMLKQNDKVLSMDLAAGGHLTHGSHVNFSGQTYRFYHYSVDRKTHFLDYEEIKKVAQKIKPKLIVCGASSYPRKIDFCEFAKIARLTNSLLLADIAHIAGLVAAGKHPQPFPYCDIVTSTTHKTLRGPRGGFILSKKKYADKIAKAVFPGLQGGPMENIIAAIAVCFKEAQSAKFKKYIQQVITNAQALASELEKEGFDIVTKGTDNHIVLVDLRKLRIDGKEAQDLLESESIYANKNTIPYDQKSPFRPSGLRLGTAALTTQGCRVKDMKKIAQIIAKILLK